MCLYTYFLATDQNSYYRTYITWYLFYKRAHWLVGFLSHAHHKYSEENKSNTYEITVALGVGRGGRDFAILLIINPLSLIIFIYLLSLSVSDEPDTNFR